MKVAVIGGGVIGLTTAQALAADGHQVVIFDTRSGPAQGCSAANGGFLSPSHCSPWAAPGALGTVWKSLWNAAGPMRFRPPLNSQHIRWLWQSFQQCNATDFARNRQHAVELARYSRQCQNHFDQATSLRYSRQHHGVLQLVRSAASAAHTQAQIPALQAQKTQARWLNADDVLKLEPTLHRNIPELFGALHIEQEGSGQCEALCRALMPLLHRQGVTTYWNTEVKEIVLSTDPSHGKRYVTGVQTAAGVIAADACVVATGHDSVTLLRKLFSVPICPIKGYSLSIPHRFSRMPRHAILDERHRIAVAPFEDVVRVAGMADIVGNDLAVRPDRIGALTQAYQSLFPLDPSSCDLAGWAGLRPVTPDGLPLLGGTDFPGLYLNTGHGGYGWTLSFGSARLLADQLQGRSSQLDLHPYSINRFSH